MSTKTAKELLQNTSVCGECLVWNGAAYGSKTHPTPQVYVNKKYENVRALIWNELHPNDTVLNGYGVTMTCKVPKCINPGHMVRTDETLRGNLPHIDEPPVHAHCACIDCGAPVNVPAYLNGALTKVRCKACTPSMEPGSPAAEEIVRRVASGEANQDSDISRENKARQARLRAERIGGTMAGPVEPVSDPHAVESLIGEDHVADQDTAPAEETPSVSLPQPAIHPIGPRLFEAVTVALLERGVGTLVLRHLFESTVDLYAARKAVEVSL